MKQAALLDVGVASQTCGICRMPFAAGRCRICDKGETPRPGSPVWRSWVDGIIATVRARLYERDLHLLAADAVSALLLGEDVPVEAAPILSDIVRLPISARAYQRLVDVAVAAHFMEQALLKRGVEPEQAGARAAEWAEEYVARIEARPRVEVAPERFRVEVERVRVEDVPWLEIAVDDAAESEAAQAERRARR